MTVPAKRPEALKVYSQYNGKCTAVSWEPESKNMSYVKWEEAGKMMGAIGAALTWYVADWLRHGEDRYGEKFSQALEVTQRDEKTLLTWLRVARGVDPDRRRWELKFAHHELVSALDPDVQNYWLNRAVEGDLKPNNEREMWSSRRLKAEINKAGKDEDPGDIDIEVVDLALVPAEYLMPNVKEIRSAWSAGRREIPGLKLIPPAAVQGEMPA
jgi:hypothetical protein